MPIRVAPPVPEMPITPQLLPTGTIGVPKITPSNVNTEPAGKPGMRVPHFTTGINEGLGAPKPGLMSNGMGSTVHSPLSQEAKPIMDTMAGMA